jgi:organic hydroperoxide reductase OsmC/OhrA
VAHVSQRTSAMQAFPHRYTVTAVAHGQNETTLISGDLPAIPSAPPAEFDGPGDRWSPETLLVAAIADCYLLTFSAVASVARFRWTALGCQVEGVVDRVDRVTRFAEVDIRAQLTVPAGTDVEHAERLLLNAKHACLVTNSLHAIVRLEATVRSEVACTA